MKVRAFSLIDPPSDVATVDFTITPSARVAAGLTAVYRFDEGTGSIVHDVSGAAAPLNLTLDSPTGGTWAPGSISLTGGTALRGTAPAASIIFWRQGHR